MITKLKYFLSLLTIVFSSFIISQSNDSLNSTDDWKESSISTTLSADLYLSYGSTNIQNEFVSKLLFGGHIDSTIKDKASDKLNTNNRFGFEANYEVKYYNLKDTFLRKNPDFRYYFGFGSYTNLSASYSDDLFRTTFYGNKEFEGETANFDKTNLFLSDFKKLSFGVENHETGISFAISVISGNNHQLFDFDKASLTSASGGGQLDLFFNGNIQQSDSLSNGYLSFSGIGSTIDFSFRLFKTVNIKATNVGFASWKRNPSQININDSVSFSGFEVDNIFSPTEFDVNNEIDSLLPSQESKSFVSILPAIFEITSVVKADKKIQPYYGARYKINSNYFPLVYAGVFYSFNSKYKAVSTVSYGGYNTFEASLNAYYSSQNFYLGIGTRNLLGAFRKNGLGRSLNFSTMILF